MIHRLIAAALASAMIGHHLSAGEAEMNRALARWQQQVAEYQAAVKLAPSEEAREAIPAPSPDDVAPALWKAVRGVTGQREESVPAPRKDGRRAAAQKRKVDTYEFEQLWATPAVVWFLNYPDAFSKLFANDPNALAKNANAVMKAVLDVHYVSPLMADACPKLAESNREIALEIVKKVYEQSSSADARASAALTLSIILGNPTLAASEGGAAQARSKRVFYLRQALRLAGDNAMYGDTPLTAAASEQMYRLANLSVGKVPPPITLTAPNGVQTRFPRPGKPTLIFFWSSSEDVGLRMMSKQRALLAQYPGLELCPVVEHGDRERWLDTLREHNIATCYMDSADGSAGVAYRVSMLPTAVLLNERSRIVYIGYPDLQLQTALDNLFTRKPEAQQPTAPGQPPASQPTSATDSAPPLRPMPAF